MSTSGQSTVYAEILGQDIIIHFDYEVTYKGCAAKTYGSPETCYTADPIEYNLSCVGIELDVPGKSKHAMPEYLDMPKWLEKIVEDYLYDSDSVYQIIERDLSEDDREYEYDEDYYRDR